MGEVGSARYEPALLPPCPSIRALCYSNCQRSTQSHQQSKDYRVCHCTDALPFSKTKCYLWNRGGKVELEMMSDDIPVMHSSCVVWISSIKSKTGCLLNLFIQVIFCPYHIYQDICPHSPKNDLKWAMMNYITGFYPAWWRILNSFGKSHEIVFIIVSPFQLKTHSEFCWPIQQQITRNVCHS